MLPRRRGAMASHTILTRGKQQVLPVGVSQGTCRTGYGRCRTGGSVGCLRCFHMGPDVCETTTASCVA